LQFQLGDAPHICMHLQQTSSVYFSLLVLINKVIFLSFFLIIGIVTLPNLTFLNKLKLLKIVP